MQKSSIIRAGIVAAVVIVLGSLMFYNVAHPEQGFNVWNEAMTQGSKEGAAHHFIMYTDIFCPYCDKFSNALTAHQEEFDKHYLEENKVFFELRVTALNSLHAKTVEDQKNSNSQHGAEGAYCAGRQNKFWDYYHVMLKKLWDDYHSKGIGVSRDSEHIEHLEDEYFIAAARDAGLDEESFKTCYSNHETATEVENNTKRAYSITQGGIPFFQFDKLQTPGFEGYWDLDRDWVNAKKLLDAGLAS